MAQITQEQRYEIAALYELGKTKLDITNVINKHPSSIGRDLKRNSDGRSGEYK